VILNICFSVTEQISDVPDAPGYIPRLFPVVSTNSTQGKNLHVPYNVFQEQVCLLSCSYGTHLGPEGTNRLKAKCSSQVYKNLLCNLA